MGIDEETVAEKLEVKEENIEEKTVKAPSLKPRKPRAKKETVLKQKLEKKEAEVPRKSEEAVELKEAETKIIVEEMKIQTPIKIEKGGEEAPKKYDGPAGQLAVDVYQTETELVIQSAIAGVKADSIDISLEGDMVTITGTREKPQEDSERNYIYQECYWGPFARQIMMSVEVDPSRTEASLKDGILTIRIPKIDKEKKRKIVVKE